MENTVEVDGKTYSIGKINAWTSFHVFRRLIPILSSLANAMRGSIGAKTADAAQTQASFAVGLNAIATSLAGMTDADIDYVLKACMQVCRRKDGEQWFPMMSPSGVLMYSEDMSASSLMQLTAATLQRQEGLLDFFTKGANSSAQSGEAVATGNQ